MLSATRSLATLLDPARKPIIVYESTVYPGVTEEVCGPLIEEVSGLRRGRDFFLGYSPERINPGDREHTVEKIQKVVAGENDEVTDRLAGIYGRITSGGVFTASLALTPIVADGFWVMLQPLSLGRHVLKFKAGPGPDQDVTYMLRVSR